jgi:phosphoglycolate phosphatase-like HAD superfamily hydrolase
MNLVLFDIDGTLTHTVSTDEDCFTSAYSEALGIPNINTDWSVYSHCVDSTICHEIIQSRLGRHPMDDEIRRLKECFVDHLRACALKDPLSFQPIPGVVELLAHLRSRKDWVLAIATGGWECSARLKLELAGIEVDGIPLASADDGFTREKILSIAISRAKAHYGQDEYGRIVSVGDGIWDVICASRMEMPFIGIAEGAQREKLKMLGAQHLLEDYQDLDGFMCMLREAVVPL